MDLFSIFHGRSHPPRLRSPRSRTWGWRAPWSSYRLTGTTPPPSVMHQSLGWRPGLSHGWTPKRRLCWSRRHPSSISRFSSLLRAQGLSPLCLPHFVDLLRASAPLPLFLPGRAKVGTDHLLHAAFAGVGELAPFGVYPLGPGHTAFLKSLTLFLVCVCMLHMEHLKLPGLSWTKARLAPLLDQSSPAFRWKHGRGPDMFSIRRPSLRAYQQDRVPHPLGHDIERTLPFFCGPDASRSDHTALVEGLSACTLTCCLRPCVPSLLDALATTRPRPYGAANRDLQASAMKFSMVGFSERTRHARCFTRAEAKDWYWWSVWIRNKAGRTGREPRTSSTSCFQVWLEWSRGGHHTVPPLFDPRRLAKHSFLFGQLAATTRAAWGGAEHVLDTWPICLSWERSLFRWRGKVRAFRPLVTETGPGVPPPRNSVCRTSWCDDDMELSFHARGPEQLLFRHVLRPEGCPRLCVSDQSLRFSLSWPRENLHVSRFFLHLEDLYDAFCQLFTRSLLDMNESWRHQILLRPSF